jgi:hypothetical protein
MREIRTSGSTRGGAPRSPPTLPVLYQLGADLESLRTDHGSKYVSRGHYPNKTYAMLIPK